jgi:hypothetical protein
VKTLRLLLLGSHGMVIDNIELEVRDESSCEREVLAAVTRERWCLSVGDRIEIREKGSRDGSG